MLKVLFFSFILINFSNFAFSSTVAARRALCGTSLKCLSCALWKRLVGSLDPSLPTPEGSRKIFIEYPIDTGSTVAKEVFATCEEEEFLEAARTGTAEEVKESFEKKCYNPEMTVENAALAFARMRTDKHADEVNKLLFHLNCGFNPTNIFC